MKNNDSMYVLQLEAARNDAEIEIKALEDELKHCREIMAKMGEALNPTYMGEPLITMGDLAMLTKRLAHALREAAPAHDLPTRALDYLQRMGLLGSPLRETHNVE